MSVLISGSGTCYGDSARAAPHDDGAAADKRAARWCGPRALPRCRGHVRLSWRGARPWSAN